MSHRPPSVPPHRSFNFMWISSFKAISWALNRGALVTQPFNFVQFLVVYAAPVTPVATAPAGAAGKPAAAAAAAAATAAVGEPAGPAPAESSKDSAAAAPATADGGAAAEVRKGRLAEDAGDTSTMLRVWATKGAVPTGYLGSGCRAALHWGDSIAQQLVPSF